MDSLNIHAIHPKPSLSKPNKQNKKYPYLLRNVEITHVNQVWSTDITYIRPSAIYPSSHTHHSSSSSS